MRNMRKVIALTLLVIFSAPLSFAQEKSPRKESYEKGKVEAAENIEKEIYVIKAWGLPSSSIFPWPTRDEMYQSILKEKYRISFEWVGGCMVDEETSDYADGYNEVSLAGIEAKYGKGILEKVRQQAETEHESKYGEKEREYSRKFQEGIKTIPKGSSLFLLDALKSLPTP
jgi:hypothetical protein